jgi:hypothetical protein
MKRNTNETKVAVNELDIVATRQEIDALCAVIDRLRRYWSPSDSVNLGGYTQGAAWFLETLSGQKKFAKTWKTKYPLSRDGEGGIPADVYAREVVPLVTEHMARMAKLADEIEVDPETTQAALPGVDLVELKAWATDSVMADAMSLYYEKFAGIDVSVALLKTDDDPEGITPEFLDQLVAEGKAVKGVVQPGETLADAIMRTAAGMQS